MSKTTSVNIRIDSELKSHAETFFADIGLNMSSAFNIFVRQSLRQGKIPFEILGISDPFYSVSNITALENSISELKSGKTVTKSISELTQNQ
jgi:DNA-damage-inducible protein J